MKNIVDEKLQMFANLMIKKIETAGEWQRPWINVHRGRPMNLRGTYYNGFNMLILAMFCDDYSWKAPVFLTFNQAKEANLTVTKGAHAVPVFYYQMIFKHKITGNKITQEEYNKLTPSEQQQYTCFPFLRFYMVFNVEQTNYSEVYPAEWATLMARYTSTPLNENNYQNSYLDTMLEQRSWLCPINVKLSNRAFYSVLQDEITVPLKEQATSAMGFYGTLLHEMSHSTGAEGRLNRDLCREKYAHEELVADLSAAICGLSLGVTKTVETNAEYLKHWLFAIKENPRYIFNVLGEAAKAANMICQHLQVELSTEAAA